MKLVISVILLCLVLLLPLYVVAMVIRFALNSVDAFFEKSLVEGKDAVKAGPPGRRLRNTLLGWLFSLVLFTVLVVGLPAPPDLDRDKSLELVESMYETGQSALRIEFADSLLNDLQFDEELVKKICSGVPGVIYGSHQYSLECLMLEEKLVSIRVMDRGREVYAGTWEIP